MLGVMIFNLIGYRWIFSVLENNATADLEQKITAGAYSDDQLVEIRIPLNMPYYSDKDYENIYGETDWNGQHYRYVKRKVSNNTLYLLCLPNTEKTSLVKIKNEFGKAVNDIPTDKQGSNQKNSFIKLLTAEYKKTESFTYEDGISSLSLQFIERNISANSVYAPLAEGQPPEIL